MKIHDTAANIWLLKVLKRTFVLLFGVECWFGQNASLYR